MLENKIWTQAVNAVRDVNGDAEELASLVRENPWLPKHWGPFDKEVAGRDQEDTTLLMVAAWEDCGDAAAFLAPISDVRALDAQGESAIFYAVLCKNDQERQKMVEALARYADLGARSRYRLNKSAAMVSVERKQSATARFLLSQMTSEQMERQCGRGANIWHYICRFWSAELSWIDMIEQKPGAALLLDVEDSEGATPRNLASKRGDEFGARLLAKAEAMEMNAMIGEAASVKNRPRL